MKPLYTITLSAALLLATATASAQTTAPIKKLSPRGKAMTKAPATPTETVLAYITTGPDADWHTLDSLGVKITLRLDGVATARIPLAKLAEVAATRGVTYVQTATPVDQMLDRARPEAGADKVAAGKELDKPYTGSGVVVGIVDAGFDYTHAAFYDSDRNLRIKRVWEQSSTPFGDYKSPDGFGYGIELSTPEQIENAGGDIANNSHGTHVAGMAAGSDDYLDGAFHGTAPDADIVLVSMGSASRDNVNLTNAIAYIFGYAEAEGKPCVINLSLGNHTGPHDGTSTFDVIADGLQGPGRLIVGSAGNHRADAFHVARTFTGDGDEPLRTFVSFKTAMSSYNTGGDIEIWGEAGTDFEVELASYNLSGKKDVTSVKVYPSDEAVQSVELDRNLPGSITVTSETSPLNGKPHVVLTSALTGVRNNYAPALKITPKGKGHVDVWADNTLVGLTDNGIEGFCAPGTESTIAEIGGTAKRILTVGAYTTRDRYLLYGAEEGRDSTLLDKETPGGIGSFSSYGPTADGRLKPEVTAPGCFIISAESSNDASGTLLISHRYSDDKREYLYGYMQGTSMAAPFVTGVVATWLQACPTLSPEQLKEIVKATSRHDANTGDISADGDNSWGYGKIDAYEGLKKCIEISETGISLAKAPFDGTITHSGDCIRIIPATASVSAEAAIYTTGGALAASHPVSGDTTISTAALPAGIYLLKVSDGKGVKTIKFCK